MLVLSRKRDESIIIGDNVVVTIIDIRGEQVKLGVSAPKTISIHRKEVYEAIQAENVAASRPEAQNLAGLAQVLKQAPTSAKTPTESQKPSS